MAIKLEEDYKENKWIRIESNGFHYLETFDSHGLKKDIDKLVLWQLIVPNNIINQKEFIIFVNEKLKTLFRTYKMYLDEINKLCGQFLEYNKIENVKTFIKITNRSIDNFNFDIQIILGNEFFTIKYI